MSKAITVVVPLVKAHDAYVMDIISELRDEASVVKEVVLARSRLARAESEGFEDLVREAAAIVPFPVTSLATRTRQTAGENRNRGARVASTPFVAFMDADDMYAQGRLTLMLDVAHRYGSNLVVHDFCAATDELRDWSGARPPDSSIVASDALYEATFASGRNRKLEGSTPGDTNLNLPAPIAKHHRIHHGHTLVRTSVFDQVAFSRIYPGEDGQFCRDVLWELGNVNYIPERLSAYRPLLSAETQSTNVDKVTRRIRAIRDQGWRALRP